MRDWASKLHGTTLRIAAILHCIEHKGNLLNNLEVSEQTMKNAIELSKYFVAHAKKAYSLMCIDKATSNAKFVLYKLKENKKSQAATEINRRDIYMMCRSASIKSPQDLEEPLNLLIEYNYLRKKSMDDTTKNSGRKPSQIYILNPLYFKKEAESCV